MKPYCISLETGDITKGNLQPGDPPPAGLRLQYLPRIRCNDCPGKLYTAQLGKVEEEFEVHLRNKKHRAAVEERLKK